MTVPSWMIKAKQWTDIYTYYVSYIKLYRTGHQKRGKEETTEEHTKHDCIKLREKLRQTHMSVMDLHSGRILFFKDTKCYPNTKDDLHIIKRINISTFKHSTCIQSLSYDTTVVVYVKTECYKNWRLPK